MRGAYAFFARVREKCLLPQFVGQKVTREAELIRENNLYIKCIGQKKARGSESDREKSLHIKSVGQKKQVKWD